MNLDPTHLHLSCVLMVENHPFVGKGLKVIIERRKAFQAVGIVETTQETLDFLKRTTVDIGVLDIEEEYRCTFEVHHSARKSIHIDLLH